MRQNQPPESFDLVIVGAGFAGLYMLHRARGLGLSAVVLEKAGDVGGTWYWNRYPGARCDVESMQYSFGFDADLQQEWHWSERFASQPEILRYAGHVADRFDLRRDIRFGATVTAAQFNAATGRWLVATDQGQRIEARFCVMATGCLSAAKLPEIEGIGDFAGPTYHPGHWPHEAVDFTGKRVAVIGTGSSAIQAIPVIAGQAAQVTVFQRTPNFSIPSRNQPMDAAYEHWWKDDYARHRQAAQAMRTGILYPTNDQPALAVDGAERQRIYDQRWQMGGTAFMAAFNDLLLDNAANQTAADYVRARIRQIVQDPATAEALAPQDHPIGTKRICVDTRYYETYNRPNVKLVNLRQSPLQRITPHGVLTSAGEVAADALVLATGFDAMTGALLAMDIRGRDGASLAEAWQEGPRTYLGLMAAGFPNLFMITGPGSPSVLSNMILSIEQHVDWVSDCLAHMAGRQQTVVEPTSQAQDEWVAHGIEVAARTLYPQAASWYMGTNVPGKPRVFLPYVGGVGRYRQLCEEIVADDYRGFRFAS